MTSNPIRARRCRVALLAGLALVSLPVSAAHAQAAEPTLSSTPTSANEGPLAEALFRSARSLAAEGKYIEACPKFAESQRIDPKLGTLMNLALCHQKQGMTATAWAEYTQAAELAARAGQGERERVARTNATTLEAILSHLVLRAAAKDSISITLDGQTVGAAALGTPIPVDPGVHQIGASGPGRRSFTRSLMVAAGGTEQTVTIPPLDAVGSNESAAVVPLALVPPAPAQATPSSSSFPYGHRSLGYVLLAGGAAAIATGAVFGVVAIGKKSAANAQCGAELCTQAGLDDISTQRTAEAVSTVGVGVGVVAAGAGLYFVLRSGTRPDSTAASSEAPAGQDAARTKEHPLAQLSTRISPLVGPGLQGLVFSGAF